MSRSGGGLISRFGRPSAVKLSLRMRGRPIPDGRRGGAGGADAGLLGLGGGAATGVGATGAGGGTNVGLGGGGACRLACV